MTIKGISDLYEYCCDGKFYEWLFQDNREKRQKNICMGPVYYKDDEILTLIEDNYDPIDEEKSTWKIARFSDGTRDNRLSHRPYKTFQLETHDDLLVIKCKIRPVLLIKKIESDWRIPNNYLSKSWLCLPLFSYKRRHFQKYVLQDQGIQVPYRFYFPPGIPGLDEESAGLIDEIQCIPEKNLYHKKCFCEDSEPKMERPIELSEKAFQAVIGHIAQFLPGINVSGEALEWYEFFKELVKEEIEKIAPFNKNNL